MTTYFDSSVLLSLLVGDTHAERAFALWHGEQYRVASMLLAVETRTVIRRLPHSTNKKFLEARLDTALEEVILKPLDEDILRIVTETSTLSGCRTLDVVHLATALYFQAAADLDYKFCTFDTRMAKVAEQIGLKLHT